MADTTDLAVGPDGDEDRFEYDLNLDEAIRTVIVARDSVDGQLAMRCRDCERPCYYDDADGDNDYHHAVDPERGCFLILAEDRPDDTRHPLYGRPRP